MPYTKAYAGGWQNGSAGSTPIDAAALNVLEAGIETAYNNFQRSATSPTSPSVGHVWYDTTTNLLKNWNGSAWVYAVPSGSVVQTIVVRSDTRTSYASNTTGDGTTVSALNLVITPRFASSTIICDWMINGEISQDNMFLIHKNGTLITASGNTGYNSVVGNFRYSGMVSGAYDNNDNSTPSNFKLLYADSTTASTASRTYAPAVRASGTTAYALYLNQTVAGTVGDSYESMVSIGVAMEVAA